MTASPALPTTSRSAIVLIALLQGLMLYAAQETADSWPFHALGNRVCWYAWVLSVPTAVALTLVQLRDRRLWLHAGLASLLVLALASGIGWTLGGGATGLEQSGVLWPFSISMAIAVFVSLPWWQFRLQHGHWRAPYSALFEHAWQNGLTLALAVAFTGLTWLLLWLWAALFQLVAIRFFRDLFGEAAFIALATGTLFGFGVLIGRTQHRAIQMVRSVLFAVGRGLLPLLAFIALLFVLSLPFTGLEPLWRTRSAASLLITLSLLLVMFVNAVYQHDSDQPPYPAWLRRLVEAALLALPVYAAVALYAMGLRIAQYGWTPERSWGALVAVLVCGYALGYALAVLRPGARWLQGLEPVNRWMCWAVLGSAVLANSPLLDPLRISAGSQLARVQAGAPAIDAEQATTLRFAYGRHGVDALKTLQRDPRFSQDARAAGVIASALARDTRWGPDNQLGDIDDGIADLPALQRQLTLAKGLPAPDPDWWQAVLARTLATSDCLDVGQDCVVLRRDLDSDGVDEVLLCNLSPHRRAYCRVHARDAGRWQDVGTLSFPEGDGTDGVARGNTALRDGQLQLQAPRWPRLSIDGGPAQTIDETAYKESRP